MDTGRADTANTILSLSKDIIKQLMDFQDALNSHFVRNPVPECGESKVSAQRDNVLDEVLDNLQEARELSFRIKLFVSSEVLPKIN